MLGDKGVTLGSSECMDFEKVRRPNEQTHNAEGAISNRCSTRDNQLDVKTAFLIRNLKNWRFTCIRRTGTKSRLGFETM